MAKVAREVVEQSGVDVYKLVDLLVKKRFSGTDDLLLLHDFEG